MSHSQCHRPHVTLTTISTSINHVHICTGDATVVCISTRGVKRCAFFCLLNGLKKYIYIYFEEINTFIQKGYIKLVKSDIKDIYNVIKDFNVK